MQTKKKKSRVWLWVVLAVVLTIVVGVVALTSVAKNAAKPVYTAYTIETGTVERTITGSGRLLAADTETLQLPGGVHVATVPVKAGDAIQAGDVIATLDVNSLRDLASSMSTELSTLDQQISTRSDVTQITAPVRGRVKYLPATIGSDVLSVIGEYGALALLSTDGKMQVVIETTADLALYSNVSVRWDGGKATGMLYEKTATGYLVTLTDKSTPYQVTAQVYDGDTLLGEGTLDIHAPVAVLATGGEITEITVKENSVIYANHKLFSIKNAPASASYNTSFSDRSEKAALYAQLLAYIQDPRVIAPVDGFINEVKITENTDVPAATASDGLTDALVLHTGGAVKLTIDADELDIDAVAIGQTANVTLDAYPGETFEATVTHISRIGEESGTITTYPVEVTLSYDERLLEGMNGSAIILTSKQENVPVLPVDMINEDSAGAYVTVKTASGAYERRDITTGLSDGTNAEVTSGLVAGDVIWYLDKTAALGVGGMNFGQNRTDSTQQDNTTKVGG